MVGIQQLEREVSEQEIYNNGVSPQRHTNNSWRDYLNSETYRQKQKSVDDKIKKLYNYSHDQEIRKKVVPPENFRGNPDYSQVEDDFKSAAITFEALKKGNYISRRIKEIAGVPLEIYLYSLDNPDSNSSRVTRDLYIAKQQEVWPAKCRVSGHGVILSNLEIRDKLKKQVIGWSHSHASIDPFFSEDDRNNITRLLETNGLKKYIRVFDNTYRGEGYKGVEYEIRYTPAIVFNALNAKPFVAIAVEYTRLYDGQKVFNVNENVQLRVIKEVNGIDMDTNSIDKQILERVSFNGRRLDDSIPRGWYKPKPIREEVRVPIREKPEVPLTERVLQLEEAYKQVKERIGRLEIRNIRLKGMYKALRSRYKALQKEYKPKKRRRFLPKFNFRRG